MATKNNRQYTMHIGRNENLRDYTGYGIFENSTTKIALQFKKLDSFDQIMSTLQDVINDFELFIKNKKSQLKQFRMIRNDYVKVTPSGEWLYCSFRFIKLEENKSDIIVDFDTMYIPYMKMKTYIKMLQTALDELTETLEEHSR